MAQLVKESACSAEDLGSILGLRRSPGEGKGYPLWCSDLENSMDCIVRGVAKSWTWLELKGKALHLYLHPCTWLLLLTLSARPADPAWGGQRPQKTGLPRTCTPELLSEVGPWSVVCFQNTGRSTKWTEKQSKEVLSQVKRKRPRYVKTTEEWTSSQLREKDREKEGIRFPKAKAFAQQRKL